MKIIIGGAGEVGFHLAKLLSNELNDIIIVDMDKEKLSFIENNLDVMAFRGDITSFNALKEIKVDEADMFITVTQLQNTNLTSAMIAKKMGAKKTIARISNPEFLHADNQLWIRSLGIDTIISPEQLAASEIYSLIQQSAFNTMHSFANSQLFLVGTILDSDSKILGKKYGDMYLTTKGGIENLFLPIAIIRSNERGEYITIIPDVNTEFKLGDQIYFIVKKSGIIEIYKILGKKQEYFKNIIVLGGGSIGVKTSKILKENKHNVKLIEIDRHKAFDLADELSDILIINGDGRDGELLTEEGISDSDAFIAVTGSSETNIMSCLLAKSKGVKKTIALVENIDYIHLSQEVGINAFINKKLLSADSIFRYIRQGQVMDVTGISDLDAEVLEFKIQENSNSAFKKIKDFPYKDGAVIAGIVRKNEGWIPSNEFIIEPFDRVVVFTKSHLLSKVTKYFK
ncbi:Trk system potassium transporter TrkA [Faecalibacter rhinopitheci]|uniref:Trk system potassium uptake protein TrkA n=1 Tax=Faecalibacter rhinopitheci TaxID=2779678 RepID=A0A8J7G4F4_9FLAO|nr:Trk system potassium transporter TrkA [Faecalibacter rhinopitheci]MBF0596090.1 Trk system potassium transporter TrkA [Faecalibacter rhinopitheci]MBQ0148142.1 Trk system potassium transporter TrkA [Candidatus Onthonaster equi]